MNGVFDKKAKTVYIDTGEKHGKKSAVLGTFFLFLCVYAGCFGLASCVIESFEFEISKYWVAFEILKYLLFFTAVYFLPSRLFMVITLLGGAGFTTFYVWTNLQQLIKIGSAALNWCLFRINQAGYNIGALVDRPLAMDTPHADYLIIFTFALILVTGVFSYLIYSRKNVFFNVIVSVAVIFPGFFYGLIPSYFSFSLVAAFWISNFAVNMFDSGYITRLVYKQGAIPENKLAKIKLNEFKKEYKKSIKNIKSEIKLIARLPNPDENTLKLERLLRQLETYKKPGFLFIKFYGLDKLKLRKSKKKFVNHVKIEKKKIKQELKEIKKVEQAEKIKERNAFKALTFTERIKINFKNNFNEKKSFFARGGFGAISAFIVALAAIIVVQPFIAPDARFSLAMPEQILSTLTSTVEYALVGSDSRVYGGYGGGMGGGNLYKPGGVNFKNKPILQIDVQNSPRINSGVIYLKGFIGSIYDGKKWQEVDKNYIIEYNKMMTHSIFANYKPETYFRTFTDAMQDVVGAPYNRRAVELKSDRININHLVRGGRLIFTPYFTNAVLASTNRIQTVADLNTQVTNSLFRYPQYTIEFYSVDNVLDRLSKNAVSDMRDYLQRYNNLFTDVSFWSPEQIEARFPGAFLLNYDEAMDFVSINKDFSEKYIINYNVYSEDGGYNLINIETPDSFIYNYVFIPKEYEDEWSQLMGESPYFRYGGILPSDYLLSEMAYYNFVRNYYLQLPGEIPQEVISLAQELTQDCETDYDKALALEDYLARNYEYTLNPREPYDVEQDFVYNFLFDVKEGYCSYYATAMTVMMRALGIPAREVEGYIVDTRKITRDENGKPLAIVVLDSNAHAWTEVYLRGIGWIPFEPTAAYYQEEEVQEVAPYVYTPPVRLPGYMEPMPLSIEEEEETDESVASENERNYSNLYKTLIILLSVIFVILVFYFINYVINNRRFKYFKTAEANAATVKMLYYVLKFLRLCGFVIRSDEGLVEFAKRIASSFPMMHSNGWVNIMRIMQKARYSVHEISEKEREYVYKFLSDLREECLKNLKFRMKFRLRFLRFVI